MLIKIIKQFQRLVRYKLIKTDADFKKWYKQ